MIFCASVMLVLVTPHTDLLFCAAGFVRLWSTEEPRRERPGRSAVEKQHAGGTATVAAATRRAASVDERRPSTLRIQPTHGSLGPLGSLDYHHRRTLELVLQKSPADFCDPEKLHWDRQNPAFVFSFKT